MSDVIRQRIQQRLEELNLTPNAATSLMGIDRSVLRKFMNGSVRELRENNLRAVAKGLGVSTAWLRGESETVDAVGPSETVRLGPGDVRIVGIAETGAIHPVEFLEQAQHGSVRNGLDPNFNAAQQFAYLVRGDGMDRAGIVDGSIAICVDPWEVGSALVDEEIVVVEHERAEDLREVSLRQLSVRQDGIELLARSSDRRLQPIQLPVDADLRDGKVRIVGLVTSVIYRRPVKLGARTLAHRGPKGGTGGDSDTPALSAP